jgi:hypothetical protein
LKNVRSSGSSMAPSCGFRLVTTWQVLLDGVTIVAMTNLWRCDPVKTFGSLRNWSRRNEKRPLKFRKKGPKLEIRKVILASTLRILYFKGWVSQLLFHDNHFFRNQVKLFKKQVSLVCHFSVLLSLACNLLCPMRVTSYVASLWNVVPECPENVTYFVPV